MPEKTSVEKAVMAAFERHHDLNVHRYPIRLEFDFTRNALTLEGEVENIVAKKRAFEIASRVDGVDGVIDRLTVTPGDRRGDGAIRDSLIQELLQEPALLPCTLRVRHKGTMETVREHSETPDCAVEVSVDDGIIRLNGHIPSLSHKRLIGALAWWTPGCRDVINGLVVTPPETDNDDEIADALRLVLEKDPLVHADRIGIRVSNRTVTLTGLAGNKEEKKMAELDAWYLFGVNDVVNRIDVRH
ncbi:MAG TPA: BON domain-containing protein [Candidatus Methylomirabilis sp.]|nr:BON domain-containing protein [Candidatus Methylomirabilis sp.]